MLLTQLLRTEIAIFLKDASFCICCFVFFCVSRFVRFFLCFFLKRNPSVQSSRTELKISHKIIVVKRGFESIVNSGLKNTVMIVKKCFAPRKKGLPSYEQQDQLAEKLIQLKIQTEHKSIIHLKKKLNPTIYQADENHRHHHRHHYYFFRYSFIYFTTDHE